VTDVVATLVSVPFAIAVTALLRKRWPSIDGAYVYAVVLVLTVIGAVLSYYRASIPVEVWTAAGPLLAAVLALGGVQAAQHVAESGASKPLPTAAAIDEWLGREVPTVKEGSTVPPRTP